MYVLESGLGKISVTDLKTVHRVYACGGYSDISLRQCVSPCPTFCPAVIGCTEQVMNNSDKGGEFKRLHP